MLQQQSLARSGQVPSASRFQLFGSFPILQKSLEHDFSMDFPTSVPRARKTSVSAAVCILEIDIGMPAAVVVHFI
jgi:hypothetical protein